MRKSSVIMLGLLLLVFGVMVVATGWLQGTYEDDLRRSRELTDALRHRGVLREGTSILSLMRVGGGEKRLAASGPGVLIELAPSPSVLARRGALEEMLRRLCAEHLELLPPGTAVEWYELRLQMDQDPESPPFRTLLRRGQDGLLLGAAPALPAQWPPPGPGAPAESPRPAGGG